MTKFTSLTWEIILDGADGPNEVTGFLQEKEGGRRSSQKERERFEDVALWASKTEGGPMGQGIQVALEGKGKEMGSSMEFPKGTKS